MSEEVHDILLESQRQGYLGERSIPEVVAHAQQFSQALSGVSGVVADIGAGGGVPGLVVANDLPDLQIVLIDRRAKRTDFLERAVRRLRFADRVAVRTADVDDVEETFDAVIARGFGPPDVTLRAAARLCDDGAVIVISEPPNGDRWDPDLVRSLGCVRLTDTSPGVVVFRKE